MKSINNYIQEALIKKNTNVNIKHKYFPETREELVDIIKEKCENLLDDSLLYLADVDVSNIDSLEYLFQKINSNIRTKLKIIDVTEWDISNITNLRCLFFGCKNVEKILGIEHFNTANVNNISGMFYDCESLQSIDLSKWNIEKLTNFNFTFKNCKQLKSIGNIEHWIDELPVDLNERKYGAEMFIGCSRLRKKPSWYKLLKKHHYA